MLTIRSCDSLMAPQAVVEGTNDLIISTDHSTREQPDDVTCRPNAKAATARGTHFQPLRLTHREPQIRPLPTTPLQLFQAFLPPSIVSDWVKRTNEAPAPGRAGPLQQHSRQHQWKPTTVEEIYLFIGIIIHTGLHRESRVSDHWVTSQSGSQRSTQPIIKYMTYDRFQLIYRRLRTFDPEKIKPISPFDRTEEWSQHIQETSTNHYKPGTDISVDECMIRFTGRSNDITKIPTKPIPIGLKVWAVAQKGYFLRWIWHRPGDPLGPAAEQIPDERAGSKRKGKGKGRAKGTKEGNISLNPTQSVVIALVNRLPQETYHVYMDNLFSSPNLFQALRNRGHGATGTARVNCGMWKPLTDAKSADTKGHLDWPWGRIECVPTPSNEVNQIGWKDNALVLFLTSVYTGDEVITCIRKRPNTDKARGRAILQMFGNQSKKELVIPAVGANYNNEMNSVDIGDQLRSYLGYDHRFKRGGWQAVWSFLLDTVLINSFILQLRGQSEWETYTTQSNWRQRLVDEIMKEFGWKGGSRRRYKTGNESVPVLQHNLIKRGKKSRCLPCQGHQLGVPRSRSQQRRQRQALGTVSDDSLNRRANATQTGMGCDKCDVPICTDPDCWDFYHHIF